MSLDTDIQLIYLQAPKVALHCQCPAARGAYFLRVGKMAKFYQMADGTKIAEANRGANKKNIKKLQKQFWAKKHGGICGVVNLTEPQAIYYAFLEKR